ncbi:MAG: hypothetical protein LBM98_03110 [Oscillospiraceae bacterium]|jgi:hypothetical protein|nr:hypothetical protein [Oscillospiraceae bacterium]
MTKNILKNIHPVVSDNRGENYDFAGNAAYVMEALAPKPDDGVRTTAKSIGVWPLPEGQYDPVLGTAGIPDGSSIFGLFDETYTRLHSPELSPELTRVSSLAELKDDCWCVLFAKSGFDYVIVKSDKPVTIKARTGSVTDYDYSLFAGVTGDNFTQIWSSAAKFRGCCASDYLNSREFAESVFDKIGYATEYVTDNLQFVRKAVESIDLGVPALILSPTPAWNLASWSVVVGYEDSGQTLLVMQSNRSVPMRVSSTVAEALLLVVKNVRDLPLAQVYREAIERLPKLLTTKTDDYVFGSEAFREWANYIERGGYDSVDVEGDAQWDSYTNYVCVLATNGSCCHSFLEKAMELNPDMTFLSEISALYRRTAEMWGGESGNNDSDSLEVLGGGFNVTNNALSTSGNRLRIVAKIRECAEVIDEVVSLLTSSLAL